MNDLRRPPIETDPLGAIRKELLSAAWRKKAQGDRRRRILATASSALVLFVCAAGGAGALGLDVPVVGDALQAFVAQREENRDPREGVGSERTLPKAPANLEPGVGNTTDALSFAWGDAGHTAVAAAYLNTQGQSCFIVAPPDGPRTPSGCIPVPALSQRLDQGIAYLSGIQLGESVVIVTGYVTVEIDDVAVRGPDGALAVELSRPWTPRIAGGSPLRAFVATAATTTRSGRANALDVAALLDRSNYEIDGRLDDGRTVTVKP